MKSLLKNFSVFIVLSIFISGLAACGNKSADNQAADNKVAQINSLPSNVADNTATTPAQSDFPPVPSAVATADIKMTDGKTIKIAEQKGSVILINLWATWCGPCRAEMPDLVILQDKYRDKNFKILGLDADSESESDVKAFAGKMKLNYDLGWADAKIMGELLKFSNFSGIPQSFLIDRQGRVRGVFTGGGPVVIGKLKTTLEKVVNE